MKRIFLFLLFWALAGQLFSQVAPDKYYIQFTDKKNSPFMLDKPEAFLSARALARRARYGIPIKRNDLPVNPQYLDSIANTGVKILNTSRWLNGVTVFTQNKALIDSIRRFSFVKSTLKVALAHPRYDKFKKEAAIPVANAPVFKSKDTTEAGYGAALMQIKQIDGIALHRNGFRGKGMVIAVLDAGYRNVSTQPLFDSLREDHRLLGTKDFVNPGGSVYLPHDHGRKVLSCMAANMPGVMIGTAPEAAYWLLRSEDGASENLIEEYNWVSAAEFADSVGADIINSSLGYTSFDDTTFSHSYSDLNGKTAVSTRGAEVAASKGMLVVNSAGNSGDDPNFRWVGAPADGDSVLTAGAVTATGARAFFSSIGPTYDGRIKPTVMALGQSDAVANATDSVTRASGTSFSSPVLAGMCACLWEAHPAATNMQIVEALKKTASFSSHPDNNMGWGIPDFAKADSLLTKILGVPYPHSDKNQLKAYPNPFTAGITIFLPGKDAGQVRFTFYSLDGKVVFAKDFVVQSARLTISEEKLPALSPGIYLFRITSAHETYFGKVIKR
jgi:serine protease AprX